MTTSAVEFDPFSDEYFDDPTEVYRRLRDEAPVYFSERYGFYALSRFADVVAAHRDWQGFSSAHGVDLSTLSKDEAMIREVITSFLGPLEQRDELDVVADFSAPFPVEVISRMRPPARP